METLLETISRLKSEKDKKHIKPLLVTLSELKNERARLVDDELKFLSENGEIQITRLINEIGII